jgi:two-component system, OmpR family, response regulator AdeR
LFLSKEVVRLKELKILVADDSEAVREQLQRAFSLVDGLTLIAAASANEAPTLIQAHKPEVVVLDIAMPHRDGIQVLKEIRKENRTTQIIMFTADPSVVLKEACLEAGADFYLHKTQLQELIDICSDRLAQI